MIKKNDAEMATTESAGSAVVETTGAETVGARIKRLREMLGLSQAELGRRVGRDAGTVSRWERDLMRPKTKEAALMADMFGERPESFADGVPDSIVPLGAASPHARTVKLVGDLAAGNWREAIESDEPEEFIAYLPRPLRNMPLQAYTVRGTSMNRLYPDGTVVFAAPLISSGLTLKNGQRVVVQRRDRNGLYEATLKEYVVGEDGQRWLWPRSTDPEHQAPIRYDGAEEVEVTGVVVLAQLYELGR